MSSKDRDEINRVSAETQARIAAAQASCHEMDSHADQSKSVIARSLELLGRRFNKLRD